MKATTEQIKLKEIMESSGLDMLETAKQLFPTNKYPKVALSRILDGKAFLDSHQLSKLALMTGMTVSELYGGQWKQQSKGDVLVFTSESYRAELDTKSWIIKVFDNGSLFHETLIVSGSTVLSELLKKLNSIIINHKKTSLRL